MMCPFGWFMMFLTVAWITGGMFVMVLTYKPAVNERNTQDEIEQL